MEILILPRLSYSGKDKSQEFPYVKCSLVVQDVTYAIVKVDVSERNDVTKPHSNVITIWRASAIEMNALLKISRSEMKRVQENDSVMCVRGRQKNPFFRD